MDSNLRDIIESNRPSVILSNARASLLKPSLPVTPRVEEDRRVVVRNAKASKPSEQYPEKSKDHSYDRANPSQSSKSKKTNEKHQAASKEMHNVTTASPAVTESKPAKESKSKGPDLDDEESDTEDLLTLEINTSMGVLATIKMTIDGLPKCSPNQYAEKLLSLNEVVDQLALILQRNPAPHVTQEADSTRTYVLQHLLDETNRPKDVVVTTRVCLLCLKLIRGGYQNREIAEQVCELIYVTSGDRACDAIFSREGLLEKIVHSLVPLSNASMLQCVTYLVNALRFISQDSAENKKCVSLYGIVPISGELLTSALTGDDPGAPQLICQIVSLLRSAVDDKRTQAQFVNSGIVESILQAITDFPEDYDLCLICTRVMSKLSSNSKCRSLFTCPPFLKLLERYYSQETTLCIRVCYILGNMTTRNSAARQSFYRDGDGVQVVCAAFGYFARNYIETIQKFMHKNDVSSISNEERNQVHELEDSLTKIIRLIANIAIDEKIGTKLVQNDDLLLLFKILELVLEDEASIVSGEEGFVEELALNAISCITNISFYASSEDDIFQTSENVKILLPFLFAANTEVVLETLRVFGNFSRYDHLHATISECRVDEAILILVEHTSRDIVVAACGVLTNLVSFADTSKLMREIHALPCILKILRNTGVGDFEVSARIMMLLHNYSKSNTWDSDFESQLYHTLEELIDIAVDFVEDASVEEKEHLHLFLEVGNKLLNQIKSNSN